MQGRRRRHELLFLQLPYVSTASGTQTHPSSEHVGSLVLCFHTSVSSAAGPTDMLASGRLTGCYGHIERRLRGFLCPNPKQVCQLVEYSCDQAGVRPLPSPRDGHGNRIPALDLSGDYDERPHLPLACKWQRDSSAVSGHKEQEISLAVSTPNHHACISCTTVELIHSRKKRQNHILIPQVIYFFISVPKLLSFWYRYEKTDHL